MFIKLLYLRRHLSTTICADLLSLYLLSVQYKLFALLQILLDHAVRTADLGAPPFPVPSVLLQAAAAQHLVHAEVLRGSIARHLSVRVTLIV